MIGVPSLAPAQVAACPLSDGNGENFEARIDCLEEMLSASEATQDLLRQSLLDFAEDFEVLSREVRGPAKGMQPIEAVEVAILNTWSRLAPGQQIICAAVPESPDGFVRVGGGHSSPLQITNPRTGPFNISQYIHPEAVRLSSLCGPPQVCRDFGCSVQSLATGCFVRVEWYEWYSKRSWFSLDPMEVCR